MPRRRQAYSISLATRINALQWRRNERDGVSNHQPRDCLLNRLSGADQRKIKVPPVTGLRAGNLPVTGEFLVQRASNAEEVAIWWRHHATKKC